MVGRLVLVSIFPSYFPFYAEGAVERESATIFSRRAVPIWAMELRLGEAREVSSPDKRKAVVVTRIASMGPYDVKILTDGRAVKTDIGYLVNSELAWAPDSTSLFVSWSDGGNVGMYRLWVMGVREGGVEIVEPTAAVRRDFRAWSPRCYEPEEPNIGAIMWMDRSSRMLVAAEVPPHSNCDSFGTFRAYEIAVPSGRIQKRYGQIRAKRLFWRNLGEELRGADDECVLKPKACWIPDLHRKKQ